MKLNCVANEQMSCVQPNFFSEVKLITFANYPIAEKHIFVSVCAGVYAHVGALNEHVCRVYIRGQLLGTCLLLSPHVGPGESGSG